MKLSYSVRHRYCSNSLGQYFGSHSWSRRFSKFTYLSCCHSFGLQNCCFPWQFSWLAHLDVNLFHIENLNDHLLMLRYSKSDRQIALHLKSAPHSAHPDPCCAYKEASRYKSHIDLRNEISFDVDYLKPYESNSTFPFQLS